jgi:hypothetical protein
MKQQRRLLLANHPGKNPTVKVQGVYTTKKTSDQRTDRQKQDALHCALLSFPSQSVLS